MTVASPPSEALPPAEPNENALLGGRVRLLQARDGYRAGMDAALLAAAVPARPGERVLEAGCGVGAVLTQIAARRSGVVLTGIERDAAAVDMGGRNVILNGLQDRMVVRHGDVAAGFAAPGLARFDWAVSNPPFFDDETALRAPSPARRGAWIADDGLAVWTRFLSDGVRDGAHDPASAARSPSFCLRSIGSGRCSRRSAVSAQVGPSGRLTTPSSARPVCAAAACAPTPAEVGHPARPRCRWPG